MSGTMLTDFMAIGNLGKPFGIKGEIKLNVQDEYLIAISDHNFIFLKRGGHYIPYYVEHISASKVLTIKLEKVDDPQGAKNYSGSRIYLPVQLVPDIRSNIMLAFNEVVGYSLSDQNDKILGPIQEVISYPQQELARIQYKGHEVLIPLHEDLIIEMSSENRSIQLEIADGLLDL